MDEIKIEEPYRERKKFQPFHKTYGVISFCLGICAIYPNPKTDKKRYFMIGAVCIVFLPAVYIVGLDVLFCIIRRDIINLTRHITMFCPFVLVMHKMILMNCKRAKGWQLITLLNKDYERYNAMSDDYKTIVESSIKSALFFERYWAVIMLAAAMIFPIVSSGSMIYSFLFEDTPTRYMIHDTNKPFAPREDRLKSPYFETLYIYMFTVGTFYCANFIAFDGMFGVMIYHACNKMKIFCHTLEKAFKNVEDVEHLKRQIRGVIKEQCESYEFVEIIQETFNMWLGLIFVITVVEICTCMYQLVEGRGVDPRYITLLSGMIVQIYLPCYNATLLKTTAAETTTSFYCCGWENVPNTSVRKMLMFMIARGHRPLVITAFNLFVFDMELFVGIMRSSYSMLTLLRR